MEHIDSSLGSFSGDAHTKASVDPSTGEVEIPPSVCPVCQKEMKHPTANGFCSKECELKYKVMKVEGLIAEYQDKIGQTVDKFMSMTNYLNEMIDFVEAVPQMLGDAATIGTQEYIDYFNARIQIYELKIKKRMNEILVQKNKELISHIEKNIAGITSAADAAIGGVLAPVNIVTKAIDTLIESFGKTYDVVYKTLVNTFIAYLLKPESMSFFCTSRSLSKIPSSYVIPMSIVNLNVSFSDVLNNDLIDKISTTCFPPIKSWEYCMDPKAFKIREKLSDLNCTGLRSLYSVLETYLYTGSEPMPKYERLNMKNPWFLIFLLTGFGPASQTCFGIPYYP